MGSVSVRYIVDDVDAAIRFYQEHLGFIVTMHPGPGFTLVSRGDLRLLLSTPGGGGGAGRDMPDGRHPQPGGWNRIQIEVEDLAQIVAALKQTGARFRNDIVTGNGGKQVPPRGSSRRSDRALRARPPLTWLSKTDGRPRCGGLWMVCRGALSWLAES